MADQEREKLMREAADIFLRLRDSPDDADLLAKRDAFKARGQAEREVYDKLVKMWKASGVVDPTNTPRSVVLFICGLLATAALAYEPARIAWFADLSTNEMPQQAMLASGDRVFLDADSALVDETEGADRTVALLEGAAFFDVETDLRAFTVEIGDVFVTVLGTEFETAFVDDSVLVSVVEGQVSVRLGAQSWTVGSGEQFSWTRPSGGVVTRRNQAHIATWRTDRLVYDGMTLGQAAAVIERRLNGPVLFTRNALRDIRVNGNLNLSEPRVALRVLADSAGGQVYHIPGIGHVITRR